MLQQEQMIRTIRALCKEDARIVAAAMYGSFTRGEGDQFSDVEFFLFVDDVLYASFDLSAWIAQIAPVDECFQNEFGTTIALFSTLVRGEFHSLPASSMAEVQTWANNVWVRDVNSMLVLDRTGELKQHLSVLAGSGPDRFNPTEVSLLLRRFVDWMIFGTSVLRRGEHARSLELLWFVQRYLLWMTRILEGTTEHFPTPSKALETDVSPEAYERYRACTAMLSQESLKRAYAASWAWGKEMMAALSRSFGIPQPERVIARLNERFAEWFAGSNYAKTYSEVDSSQQPPAELVAWGKPLKGAAVFFRARARARNLNRNRRNHVR